MTKNYKKKVEECKEKLPEHPKAEEAFSKLLDMGRTPKVALATIVYAVEDKTQDEVARECDVSVSSIRKCYDVVCYIMDIEIKGLPRRGQTLKEIVKEIVDIVGLNEDDYDLRNAYTFQKTGLVKIRDELIK